MSSYTTQDISGVPKRTIVIKQYAETKQNRCHAPVEQCTGHWLDPHVSTVARCPSSLPPGFTNARTCSAVQQRNSMPHGARYCMHTEALSPAVASHLLHSA